MGHATDIFLTEPSASCICAVCHDVLKGAIALNCGHTFCASCIKSIIRSTRGSGAQCPNCRVAITSNNPNYVVREIIDELQVRCPNSTECNWMGRVKDLQSHGNTCMYKVIECVVEGCTHACQRKDMINHLSDMNVKLQHIQLKYDRKLTEMETKYEGKLEECEKKYDTKLKLMERKHKKKFTEYENKLQEYEDRLQTMGGDDNKKRKRYSYSSTPDQFVVRGCGIDEINGVYSRDGECDNVPKFVRDAQYGGRAVVFTLYRYIGVWYISIIRGSEPSQTNDTDFYMFINGNRSLPPADDWESMEEYGENPPPKVYPVSL